MLIDRASTVTRLQTERAEPEAATRRHRPGGTVLAWALPHLLSYAASHGCDVARLRNLPGLRGRNLDDPDTRVAEAAAVDVWRLVTEMTSDEALGLHVAETAPAGTVDLLEYAFRSSATLGEALEELFTYRRILGDRQDSRLFHAGHLQVLTLSDTLQGQRAVFSAAFLLRLAREVTDTSLAPVTVCFVGAAPSLLFEFQRFFRSTIRFGESSNQIAFAEADMLRPLRTANPALLTVLKRRLDKMLTLSPPESVSAQVRSQLLERRPDSRATASSVGRNVGISERTLHRRLRAEGTSFRAILEGVRRELATALLREREVGIAEVAFLLGYSEVTAFHRSFRRWTGLTPHAFRSASRAEDDRATA